MFDLDAIEKDWKENSFCLSDKDILEIYKAEGITTTAFKEEIDSIKDRFPHNPTAEERLIASIFGDSKREEIEKQDKEIQDQIDACLSDRRRLSEDAQKKIIEGCMDVVFDSTRFWYDFFDAKVPIEKLYYVCLEALISSVKYCVHFSTKSCFKSYVHESIRKNIIKHMAKWEHISYRNAFYIIDKIQSDKYGIPQREELYRSEFKPYFEYDYDRMQVEKPSRMYERLKNFGEEVNFVGITSSSLFMSDYEEALADLPKRQEYIMRLSFDSNGYRHLSTKEIGDKLGVDRSKVEKTKAKALLKMRNNERLQRYIGDNKE